MKLVVKSIVAESQERRAVRNFCCSSKQKKEGERTKVEVKERKRMRRREKNVTGTSVSPPGYNDSQSLFFASSCTLVTFVLTQDRYWTLDSGHVI